jgi:predicted nucleic acid-binding protein
MVSIDAGFLGLLLHEAAKPPNDPATGLPTVNARERIEQLMDDLYAQRERVIVSTPALSEFLVLAAEDAPQYLSEISLLPSVRIEPFDEMAAVELAAIELSARRRGDKRFPLTKAVPWQKVKFDRQIVAIAKLHKAHTFYSDDKDVREIAEDIGIKGVACWDLPLPKLKDPTLFE